MSSTRSRQLEMGIYGGSGGVVGGGIVGGMDEMIVVEPPSRCSRFLYYTWKLTTCVFSHTLLISMVVSYCILGAFTFESLEAENERKVKRSISHIRNNVTEDIWKMTDGGDYIDPENWTIMVIRRLRSFETEILKAMKKDGWDGNEDEETIQWTFLGALFYSIIVITTIGYGHIAPKTHWGKVVTIFYAILGIPLMLLCLSNIGDIMATSFRFLYWRVCCYVCTKKPKRQRRNLRSARGSVRVPSRSYSVKSRNTSSMRRSARISQRSADSGFGFSENRSSYSDTECSRYNGTERANVPRLLRCSQMSHFSDSSMPANRRQRATATTTSTHNRAAVLSTETELLPSTKIPPPLSNQYAVLSPQSRGGSLDRRRRNNNNSNNNNNNRPNDMVDQAAVARTPILCNKYAVDHLAMQSTRDAVEHFTENEILDQKPMRRAQSAPRSQAYLEPPIDYDVEYAESYRKKRRSTSHHHNPSPRIMSPMGFAVRRQYVEDYIDDDDLDDMYYSNSNGERRIKPVPIWLCVFLVVSYILGGAFLFTRWENWQFLDSAYFCFITLTTIGFGDFVPAKRVKQNNEVSIALCSLYLLFGIALLAMSFNLVQEEVIANVKSVAKRLGIIKDDDDDSSEDD